MVDFRRIEAVLEYLEALYHGLPVKMLRRKPCFTAFVEGEEVFDILGGSRKIEKSVKGFLEKGLDNLSESHVDNKG